MPLVFLIFSTLTGQSFSSESIKMPNLSLNFSLSLSSFFIESFSTKLSGLQKRIFLVFVNFAPRFAACPKP